MPYSRCHELVGGDLVGRWPCESSIDAGYLGGDSVRCPVARGSASGPRIALVTQPSRARTGLRAAIAAPPFGGGRLTAAAGRVRARVKRWRDDFGMRMTRVPRIALAAWSEPGCRGGQRRVPSCARCIKYGNRVAASRHSSAVRRRS